MQVWENHTGLTLRAQKQQFENLICGLPAKDFTTAGLVHVKECPTPNRSRNLRIKRKVGMLNLEVASQAFHEPSTKEKSAIS
ncbi:hypothetical protein SADUNF_Sadunf01G0013900 [Salix dunnii]|uniref:Uncharacterized protein n=1 Tax=Salix dunnii TaxID=1413687 RepID=A0A835N9F6_9ROSI|nr:hypothetical protein SADUNF_Sadunf01G0013900 [Salix dunnii]